MNILQICQFDIKKYLGRDFSLCCREASKLPAHKAKIMNGHGKLKKPWCIGDVWLAEDSITKQAILYRTNYDTSD